MVEVTVYEGILEGNLVQNEFGGTYNSFKGIPYALPPIGDLRFQAPQPMKPWTGVRNAKHHGPVCYQFDYITKEPPHGSEDCLYLNVYTPDLKPTNPLPVMVFIHGGGFMAGNGNDDLYGPEFLVRHGVILVTINYRLEVLGFLCLDTEEIPGNAGMKDQVAAMRWVKNNISKFGGDPENITIFGESAGATSVAYHLISPMTKGLFKRAIIQSGTANCWWGKTFEPRERAFALARKLGNFSEDDKILSQFFKSQPVESFVDTPLQLPITLAEKAKERLEMHLSIVSEKKFGDNERFFYGEVVDALRNGIHEGVEVIAGYCEDEGVGQLINGDLNKTLEVANEFREFFVPRILALNCSMKEQQEVGRRFKNFYFGNERLSMNNLNQLAKFFAFDMFVFGCIQWQRYCANKNTAFLYKFTCKSKRTFLSSSLATLPDVGKETVNHADDLAYIFPIKMFKQDIDPNSIEFRMIEQVIQLWTNFAKYGNPTPDESLGVKWTPYSLQHQSYLDIGEELVLGTAPDNEEYEFWESVFREYLPQYL